MSYPSLSPQEKNWKLVFWVISALILIVMPLISSQYGQSGDEWLQLIYGGHIWNYFVHGDQQALDYSKMSLQYQGQEMYGGLFDFLMHVVKQALPSIPILTIRHFFNALTGAGMMIYTGLIARRLSKKWNVATIALLFIVFSPRIFGESMNNPKDIPFGFGFVMGIYYLLAILQDFPAKKWKYCVGMAIGFGVAFGVRSAGGILQIGFFVVYAALFYLLYPGFRKQLAENNKKLLKQLLLVVFVALAGGYLIGLSCWPWGLVSPISHPIESLEGMTNRSTIIPVLFEGRQYPGNMVPALYEFKWIFISNPVIVIIGVVLFLALAIRIKKVYGWFPIIILAFSATFPLLYMIYKHSTMYDTWRHVFFVYPFWVVAAAMGIDAISGFLKNEKQRWIPTAVAIAGLLPAIIWTVRSHPNQYLYFNEFVGGLKGAYGYYETDYYQNTGLQAANWIREYEQKQPSPGKVFVRSNMGGFDKYFEKDTAHIITDYLRWNDRHVKDWDYYVTYSRFMAPGILQNNLWPPKDALHVIEVDGVPVSAILKRKSKAGIAANEAYQAKDYPKAIELYKEFLQKEPNDEFAWLNYAIALASTGKMDDAIGAANNAIELNPFSPEYYQLLAQLYQAKGDTNGAQQAAMKAQSIMSEQQGDNEDE